ncbi:MAG: HAMP domain-containing protein [Myxococcales bacterium]|nr:HAMP domain-containing protein [Myxococcales bacterium]
MQPFRTTAHALVQHGRRLGAMLARLRDRVRFRLRYRLALTLVFAALLPMLIIATSGVTVVLRSLERGQHRNVGGQLDVGMNLLGRWLEDLGSGAGLIASGATSDAIDAPFELRAAVVGLHEELPAALVEFYNASGALVYREVVGGEPSRFAPLRSPMMAELRPGIDEARWHRRVALVTQGDLVVAQAVAPIVDINRRTVGLVVLSVPLDEMVAETIKAWLGTEVLLVSAPTTGQWAWPTLRSTFARDASPPPRVPSARSIAPLVRGERIIADQAVGPMPFHIGWRAVFSDEGQVVGYFGVAVDRTPLVQAQAVAFRSLALAAGLGLVLALLLAALLSRWLERPIVRLRDGALAVARGDLSVKLHTSARGEIGDLARAFAQMTASLLEASREQEQKVKDRTRELSRANADLALAMTELRQAQTQLVHSERMAGLGVLVAGVAHEINSPTAAIRGAADTLSEVITQLGEVASALLGEGITTSQRLAVFAWIEATARQVSEQSTPSGVSARRLAKVMSQTHNARLLALQIDTAELARLGIENHQIEKITQLTGDNPTLLRAALRALVAYTRALRSARIIHGAIGRVMHIGSGLKTYSHIDQSSHIGPAGATVDLHAGIDSTLMLLDFALRGITVERAFAPDLPPIAGLADELNQIWTNLIQNAAFALAGQGTLRITTEREGDAVRVAIADDGPGIAPDVMPRIFEPFFTTKPKGQGTGLGLGIVRNIVQRHHGAIDCQSRPGQTIFTVTLPVTPTPT